MGGALKNLSSGKKRALHADFAPKAGDPACVSLLLGRPPMNINDAIQQLGDGDFQNIKNYTMKQKNVERVIEYCLCNDQGLKAVEVWGRVN